MRKYDIKNKRNIGIIIGISIIIIIMFSLVIKLFLSSDKKEYTVHDGALVFDKDKSIIKVTEDSTIKKKWNNEYYLKFKDNNYELGNTAISYNEKTGEIILYGKYYEIGSGDLIDVTDGETVIKSSVITKFYKLADRKYLVVDKDIKTSDGLLSTNEFLMIDLDKVGNATLVNHKVNLKAFAATSIVTSNYTFDIANEILTYGSNKIDLKKIIGSSNTYTKEDLIPEEVDSTVPTMLQWKTQADAGSLYNTPPCYGIYICGKVFKWIKKMGGLDAMKKRNEEKAKILYDFLDNSKLFKGTVVPKDRSLMNVPFVTGNEELDAKFVAEAKAAGLENLKGHRTVGGMRASIYNAMPIEGVKALVEFMEKFEKENA